jgi:hypothetical protein
MTDIRFIRKDGQSVDPGLFESNSSQALSELARAQSALPESGMTRSSEVCMRAS